MPSRACRRIDRSGPASASAIEQALTVPSKSNSLMRALASARCQRASRSTEASSDSSTRTTSALRWRSSSRSASSWQVPALERSSRKACSRWRMLSSIKPRACSHWASRAQWIACPGDCRVAARNCSRAAFSWPRDCSSCPRCEAAPPGSRRPGTLRPRSDTTGRASTEERLMGMPLKGGVTTGPIESVTSPVEAWPDKACVTRQFDERRDGGGRRDQ